MFNNANICLRCKILAGSGGGRMLLLPSYVPMQRAIPRRRANSEIGFREGPDSRRYITTGRESFQASSTSVSPEPAPSSLSSTTPASTSLKRSTSWEEGWFEGNYRTAINGEGHTYRGTGSEETGTTKEVKMSRQEQQQDENHNYKHEDGSTVVLSEAEEQGKARESLANSDSNPRGNRLPETAIKRPLNRDYEPPDERTLKLGKTIRTLQRTLPTLLSSPTTLPTDLLSPSIALHLFPSSHPHLPTARGPMAYKTALWTAPFVWGQLPGRVRLEVLAARVVKPCERGEELRVRWRAVPSNAKEKAKDKVPDPPTHPNLFPTANKSESNGGFSGLFIFTFDEKGRILTHTIEHADEGWNRGEEEVGYSFLGVAEWLLKKAKQAGEGVAEGVAGGKREPGLVFLRDGGGSLKKWHKREEGEQGSKG